MRWIDISLPPTGECPDLDAQLAIARDLQTSLSALQEREGLDSPAVVQAMLVAGQALFAGVTSRDPEAFKPASGRAGGRVPASRRPEVDRLDGYHLVGDATQVGLPWHWLHNGVEFLLARSPICAGIHGSRVPEADPPRLWMQRYSEALFAQAAGERGVGAGEPAVTPEILFVPGHGDDAIRRLMFREADAIETSLRGGLRPLARLRIPGAVTPGLLAARAMLYQALHFTAPTSQAPEVSHAGENSWLAGLIAGAGVPGAEAIDTMVGMELDVVGVDPVDAVLDHVFERYEQHPEGVARARERGAANVVTAGHAWLLDDGPVLPESLGRDGNLPPLVFSNSYCSLGWLGSRFLAAGASTFVGPAAPIYSRPARRFAAHFYAGLNDGLCAGAAVQQAALALRGELGAEHPGWLTYGLIGYGTLVLGCL